MAFYLIGLGLNERGISLHGKKILKNCTKIYLENYTVELPYTIKELEKQLKIKVEQADREKVESENIVDEAKDKDIALLVYGSPLSATTHISLINKCKREKIKYKILYSASIFDAVAESGLQLYKFGKTASVPRWQKNFTPTSFIDIIKDNQKIVAHTLILIDIGLNFEELKEQLKKTKSSLFNSEKIIVCSQLGIKSKFYYDKLENIDAEKVRAPFCLIVPGKISESEKEAMKY